MITDPDAPASMVASGLKPSVGIIGAEIDAAVITPTVADPVIMLPTTPRTNGRKIGGRPVDAMPCAITSTAGVWRRIWLSDPPSPVTMIIMADVRRAFSTQ